jgi:hypothetical protein
VLDVAAVSRNRADLRRADPATGQCTIACEPGLPHYHAEMLLALAAQLTAA